MALLELHHRRYGLLVCALVVVLGAACKVPREGLANPGASTSPASTAREPDGVATPSAVPAAPATTPSTVPAKSAAPPSGRATATPPRRRAYAVAALGDSLTDFRSHGGGFLRYLEERCPGSRFDNFGKGGDMVNQMRRRFHQGLLERPDTSYDHLIVFGGVNDLYSDLTATRTVPKIEADLTKIYAAAREHGMKVVALTVAPWGGFSRYFTEARGRTTRELNSWILAQRAAGSADFTIDTYSLLSCGNPEMLCDRFFEPFRDGLHFGPEAHRKLGRAVFETVFADCR